MVSTFLELSFPRIGRKVIEHFLHPLVKVLDVLVRLVGKDIIGDPRQISFFVFESYRSTTSVPGFYSAPPLSSKIAESAAVPPRLLHPQPPPKSS